MILITEKAQEKYKQLLAQKDKNTNIRIFVERPGTPEAECGMSFCPRNMYDLADLVYECNGFKVIIDPISDPYLSDAVVDVKNDEFTLKAPSISLNRLDPSIPLVKRIEFVIATEVNPGIATHGGAIEVLKYLEDKSELWVKFKGGCVGCASVGITIKDALCRKLTQRFPDVRISVVDKTDHEVTDTTYKG
jgi:Fe/S biogenesis protein NfuA